MRDALGGGQTTEPSTREEVVAPHQTVHHTRGVQIAGARRVDHRAAGDGLDRNLDHVVAGEQHRALGAAGDGRDLAVVPHLRDRGVERVDLVEALDLDVVGEEQVDRTFDQREERLTVAIHHEAVGERERHSLPGLVRDVGRDAIRVLRGGGVPEIALEVGDRCRRG